MTDVTSVVNTPSDEIITKTELEADYVPYTGATADVDLGEYGITASTASIGDGTNYAEFGATGDLTLYGSAKYERHIQIPATTSGTPANQANDIDFFTAGGLQYASSGSKFAFCQWEIPDDWDGTDIYIEIDWIPDSGAMTGTDAVKWDIEYRSIAEGELINNGTSVTVTSTNTDDNAQYKTIHTRFTLTYNHANQPLTKQDHMYFKVTRDTAVSGNWAGTATVTAYEIIYTSLGLPSGN